MKQSVIYKITNLVTDDIYIGSTINFKKRRQAHFKDLFNNRHRSRYLQRAFNKYGFENFKIEIIEEVSSIRLLLKREQYWLDLMNPEYNNAKIAGSCLGTKRTKASNIKNSERNRGEKNANSKIKESDIPIIFKMKKTKTAEYISKIYNVNPCTIYRLLGRKSFKHLDIPPLKGIRVQSKEGRKKLSDLAKKRRNRAIKVRAYKLNGKFIKEYPSASEAMKVLNVDVSTILKICNGITKSPLKYNFTFSSKA